MAAPDLSAILGSLSAEDMEKLKETAASLLGNLNTAGGGAASQHESDSTNNVPDLNGLQSLGMPDMAFFNSLAPVLSALNEHDDRVDFINAMKPLLSDGRRKKADEAARIIRLLSVLPVLKDRGIM